MSKEGATWTNYVIGGTVDKENEHKEGFINRGLYKVRDLVYLEITGNFRASANNAYGPSGSDPTKWLTENSVLT